MDAARELTVAIMTPERPVLQASANSVVIPAAGGELGILPGHTPLLTQLQPGAIRIRRGEATELFAVSGGYAEVREGRVTVFAETAEMAGEIDIERAKQAAERARLAMRQPLSQSDLAQAEASLRRAMVRLRAAESLRRSSRGNPRTS